MKPLPGFRDFLPADCARRNYIFAKWREVAWRYGFAEWDGPVLESTELYRKKSGEEIVGQLFNFIDKGEREVAMRPELTPTLARVVAAHEREFRKPLKWFSIPQCFRYEKQQRGRLREHFQFNADIVGETAIEADVELIALCIDLLRAFGLTSDRVVVRISDRQFWTELLKSHDVPEERWPELLQAIDKSERESREKTEEKLGRLAAPVFNIFENGGESERLESVISGLRARGLAEFASVDVRIVRGLAYYSGIVFEAFDRAGELRAIAGGGRYDNLISNLSDGAVALPALGFAMGDVVLGELIAETPAEAAVDIYVVIAKEDRRADAMQIIQQLRDSGRRVDYSLGQAKFGKQLQAAGQLGATRALIIGDEWPSVAVKNLQSGEQQLIAHEQLLGHLG